MKILSPSKQLKKILKNYKKDHKLVFRYLTNRKVKIPKDSGFISYLELDELKGSINSSIILPIRDIEGEITGVEVRALSELNRNRYSKVLKETVQLYNIHKHYKEDTIILTEGIIDCATLEKVGLKSVSALSAKARNDALHYMALFFKKIIVVFDEDDSGKSGAKGVKKFYKRYYPKIKVEIVRLKPYCKAKSKDINDLAREEPKSFKKLVKDLHSWT
jgi:DNA primase